MRFAPRDVMDTLEAVLSGCPIEIPNDPLEFELESLIRLVQEADKASEPMLGRVRSVLSGAVDPGALEPGDAALYDAALAYAFLAKTPEHEAFQAGLRMAPGSVGLDDEGHLVRTRDDGGCDLVDPS